MFLCVWLHFKKFSEKYFLMFGKEEGKDKPKKNIINDRDSRSRSRRRDLAINGASSRWHDLAIDASRDRVVDRNLADLAIDASRDRAIDRDLGQRRDRDRRRGCQTGFVVVDDFFLGYGLCFSGFVFSFFFSKHQKIFSGKFFEMQPNTWKHSPFPENVLQQPNTA